SRFGSCLLTADFRCLASLSKESIMHSVFQVVSRSGRPWSGRSRTCARARGRLGLRLGALMALPALAALFSALRPLAAGAQVPPPAPAPATAQAVPIIGEIERLTLTTPGDVWSGGTIVVGGQNVTLPRNLQIDYPANRLT